MNNDYLSIKEFSAAVGISQQAVYKQLNNKLKPYLKIVDNKKMLDKSALELFNKQQENNQVEQQLINILQTELNKKNEQIEKLQQALDQAQKLHIIDKQRILELEQKTEEELEEQPKKKWWKRKK